MPISVVCTNCGKKLRVPDDRAGKMAKCPGCMKTFMVTAAGTTTAAAPMAKPVSSLSTPGPRIKAKVSNEPGPKFEISGGMIALIVAVVVIGGGVALLKFGPLRVRSQWQEVEQDKAYEVVSDVVAQGLRFHGTGGTIYIKQKGHYSPDVRDVRFMLPFMVMSMPDQIGFRGMASEGEFAGHYNPKTGEVVCNAEVGSLVLQGLNSSVKSSGKRIRITGKKVNNEVVAQVDGKPAVIKVVTGNETE